MKHDPNPARIVVLGRFPPPIDGQSLATQRLVRLLEGAAPIDQINVSPESSEFIQSNVRFRSGRVGHYLRLRRRVRSRLRVVGESVVFWASVSPSGLGHLRDRITILPAFRPGQRVFAIVHWGNFEQLFARVWSRRSAKRLLRRIDGIIFLDERLSNKCASWIPSNKRLFIPNTIDEELLFSEADIQKKQASFSNRTSTRLLFLSNMTPSKGYFDVLKAMALLKDRAPNVEADFVGRWESEKDEADFNEYVTLNDLGGRVRHHGGVSDRSRIRQFYARADLFVLPTYYPTEAQPVTIIESLNAGTPVIATAHAGIPLMMGDGVEGRFVRQRSPESIATAVEALLDGENWRAASKAARARFMRQFHPDMVRRLWLETIGLQ